jgi:hypothetical protein
VPKVAVDPGDTGDEAVRLDRAQHRAGVRVDLQDPAIAVLAHPQAALGPGQAGVTPMPGRRDRRHHPACRRVDLVDARLGDLVQVGAVEGRAGVGRLIDRPRELPAGRVDRDQLRTSCRPDLAAVVRHAADAVDTGERAVLAHDLGGAHGGGRLCSRREGAGHRRILVVCAGAGAMDRNLPIRQRRGE